MRPSPARVEAPEPDVWLPILGVTDELEALQALETLDARDISAELEHFELEAARADLTTELQIHESQFWSTAARQLEAAVALVSYVEPQPVAPRPELGPAEPVAVAAVTAVEVDAAETEPEPEGLRARIAAAARGTDLRTRVVGTLLVVALVGTLAMVFPGVVGASVPQRYVTVSLDGVTVARTVRLATVADVLASESITMRPGDRVVPPAGSELREGMHIRVLRSFPVDVEVNGTVKTVRTTARSLRALRSELGIDRALVAHGSGALAAGTTVAFRTPHNVALEVDGHTIEVPKSAALNVAGLLAEQSIPLGPRDEVMPAAGTALTNGLRVRVFRLADNQVAEQLAIPFATEVRDDPNLPVGQSRTIQPGTPGLRRDLFRTTTRDGAVVARDRIGSELLVPPVSQVIVKGTQPLPPRATGSATWYGTGPGPGTCAHLSLAFGTVVTLTNRDTGAVAQCRVQDRGPETWTGHVIDLAPDVFRRLAPLSQGIVPNIALSW